MKVQVQVKKKPIHRPTLGRVGFEQFFTQASVVNGPVFYRLREFEGKAIDCLDRVPIRSVNSGLVGWEHPWIIVKPVRLVSAVFEEV